MIKRTDKIKLIRSAPSSPGYEFVTVEELIDFVRREALADARKAARLFLEDTETWPTNKR